MTEFISNPSQVAAASDAPPQIKARPSGKQALLAGFLSFLIPGAGQLYNRQPRKALVLALPIPILIILAAHIRIMFAFYSMVVFLGFLLLWRFLIFSEAAYSAWTGKPREAALPIPRLSYTMITIILLAAALYPSPDDFKRWTSFGAFSIPSASMCPTICMGDRVMADMGAYRMKSPERGDLVLIQHQPIAALLLKRVIGIAGDVVRQDPNGKLFINGIPLTLPQSCGEPVEQKNANAADYSDFKSTRVANGELFVIGDNLGNSYDSRVPEFGRVSLDEVRGRPIYLYWSRGKSRIGCSLR